MDGNARCRGGDIRVAYALRNIATIQQHAIAFAARFEVDHGAVRQLPERFAIVERDLLLHCLESERAIHGAAFQVHVTKLLRQPCGDGALARACRPVNGDHQLAGCTHSLPVSFAGGTGLDGDADGDFLGRRCTRGLPGWGGCGVKRGWSLGLRSTCGGGASWEETCSNTRPATWTKLNSRAAWSALIDRKSEEQG